MPDDEMRKVGFSIPQDELDEMDDIKRRWDRLESRTISRSEVAREALNIGVEALEMIDEEFDRGLTTHDRRALVRQALLDHFRRMEDDNPDDPTE